MSLEKILALGKKVSKLEENGNRMPSNNRNTISGSVDNIDNMVYGSALLPNENGQKPYDANEEMKRIKNGLPSDISNCKLPQSILESIKKNPLNDLSEDPKMDAFTERLTNAMPEGFKTFNKIQEKLDEVDNKKSLNNNASNDSSIDYDVIRNIIDESITKAFSKISKNLISESNNHGSDNNLKAMKLGSKFLFLDSDDNVFECKMVYKGKNKKHK